MANKKMALTLEVDVHAQAKLKAMKAGLGLYAWCEKTLTEAALAQPIKVTCGVCHGSGFSSLATKTTCEKCNGEGEV